MRFADIKESKVISYYMEIAANIAQQSLCKKSKRGAVIVRENEILGGGYNQATLFGYCNPCVRLEIRDNTQMEMCPEIHAEQMAIFNALNTIPKGESLNGSRLYHIKTKEGIPVYSGSPTCTSCSKPIFFLGINEVVLSHKEGYAIYPSEEFNRLSLEYQAMKAQR